MLEKTLLPRLNPTDPSGSLQNTLTNFANVWAMNEDGDGQEFFDEVGSKVGQHTDTWYIRHDSRVTSQTMISFDNNFYRIHMVRPVERNKLFMKLISEIRGSDLKLAARS